MSMALIHAKIIIVWHRFKNVTGNDTSACNVNRTRVRNILVDQWTNKTFCMSFGRQDGTINQLQIKSR
jgi:hypothetical protein